MFPHIHLEGHPLLCLILYSSSLAFGTVGIIADSVAPQTFTGTAAIIMALVALVGAIGAQLDIWRKRSIQNKLIEAKIDSNTKLIKKVTKHQVKLEESVRGLEMLRDIGVLSEPTDPPRKSILIVEDDPNTLKVYSVFLAKNLAPFTILLARTFNDAVEKLKGCPECVFLDIELDGKSGLDLLDYMKGCAQPPRVVCITGWNNPADLERAVAAGVDIWRKPMTPTDWDRLIAILRLEFGAPTRPPSSVEIPVPATSGIRNGIDPDGNLS